MMGGNTETTQRGAIAAEMVPMLIEEAKKRKGTRTDISEKNGGRSTSVPHDTEVRSGRSSEVAAKAVGVGPAKKKHEMRLPLTKTQREILSLLQRGYPLEVEKRGPGYVSHLGGAEIGGRGIRFDTAQRMIDESLVEKLSEDGRTVKYEISPTAIQILHSLAGARR